jgi:hypothetical protein
MEGSPRERRRSWSDEGRFALRPAAPDGGFSGIGHAGRHGGSGRTGAVALVEQALVTGQRPGADRSDTTHQGAEQDEPSEPPSSRRQAGKGDGASGMFTLNPRSVGAGRGRPAATPETGVLGAACSARTRLAGADQSIHTSWERHHSTTARWPAWSPRCRDARSWPPAPIGPVGERGLECEAQLVEGGPSLFLASPGQVAVHRRVDGDVVEVRPATNRSATSRT